MITHKFDNIISHCTKDKTSTLHCSHISFWVRGRKRVYSGRNCFERNYIHGKIHPTIHAEIDCMRKVLWKNQIKVSFEG